MVFHACAHYKSNCHFDLMFVTSQLKGIAVLNASIKFVILRWSRMKNIETMITQAKRFTHSGDKQLYNYHQNDNLIFTAVGLAQLN